MTVLTLNQSLSDPHSGMNTFTHFSSTQLSAYQGPGPLKGPSGNTSNEGSEPSTGKCKTSPVPIRGAQADTARELSLAATPHWGLQLVFYIYSPAPIFSKCYSLLM